MKLTKYDKQAIVKSIMNDIPKPNVDKLHADMQTALVKAMGPACRRMYATDPRALRVERIGYDYGLEWGREIVAGDANVEVVLRPFRDAHKQRQNIKEKLEKAVESCTTRKAFIDRFPEFSKYAPPEPGKCSTLPAVSNVVGDLVKLGWKQTISKGELK